MSGIILKWCIFYIYLKLASICGIGWLDILLLLLYLLFILSFQWKELIIFFWPVIYCLCKLFHNVIFTYLPAYPCSVLTMYNTYWVLFYIVFYRRYRETSGKCHIGTGKSKQFRWLPYGSCSCKCKVFYTFLSTVYAYLST